MRHLCSATELQSLDHTAANVFHRAHTPFQAPHLPPSSAVDAEHRAGPSLYAARRGRTRFRFKMALPQDLPSSASFTDAARLSYHLKAMCQVAEGPTRVLVTKVAEFQVREQWEDWHEERYFEGLRKEASEQHAGGTLVLEASVPRVLWCEGEEVQLRLYLRNTMSKAVRRLRGLLFVPKAKERLTSMCLRQVDTVHIALAEKLRVPSTRSESSDLIPAPQLIADISDQPIALQLAPREERQLEIRVPLSGHTVRGRTLFDIELVLRASVKLSAGLLGNSKDLRVELPIAVAAPGSLPPEALKALQPLQNTLDNSASEGWASPDWHLTHVPSHPATPLPPPLAPHSPFPSPCVSPSRTPALPPRTPSAAQPLYSPSILASPLALPSPMPIPSASPMVERWGTSLPAPSPIRSPVIPFTPPPREDPFLVAVDPTASLLTPSRFMNSLGMAPLPVRPERSSSDPSLITRHRSPTRPPLPPVPMTHRPRSRSSSASSSATSHPASLIPGSPRSLGADLPNETTRQQLDDLVQQGLGADPLHSAVRLTKSQRRHSAPTPPLTSPSIGEFDMPRSDALEAIGEDGESRAGSKLTIHSSRLENPTDSELSIVSTSAVRPNGLPGASSAAMLEELVEQEGYLQQEGLEYSKTLPEPPYAFESGLQPNNEPPGCPSACDIFTRDSPGPVSSQDLCTSPTTITPLDDVSNRTRPASTSKPLPMPTFKSQQGLLALERRLARSPTLFATDFGRPAPATAVAYDQTAASPSLASSQRTKGALRAKSSQMSLSEMLDASDPPKRSSKIRSAASLPVPPSRSSQAPETAKVHAWLEQTQDDATPKPVLSSPALPPSTSPPPDLTWDDSVSKVMPQQRLAKTTISKPTAQTTQPAVTRRHSRLAAPSIAGCSTPPIQEMYRSTPQHKPSSLISIHAPRGLASQTQEALALNQPPARLHPSKLVERPNSTPANDESTTKDYNVKSARGGRGGRVTSVAQLWQQISKDPKSNEAPPLPANM